MKIISNNKKAFHNFFISDLYECGIALVGSEVKSVRQGGISLSDSYVQIKNGELILVNTYIKPYENAANFKPEDRRSRKLLMHKAEIEKLDKKVKEKGYSLVPTKVYLKNGLIKVEIGLAKGKKLYDKREVLKEKSVKMDIDRATRRV